MAFLRKIISVILKRLKIQADILQSFGTLFSSFSGNLFNGCISKDNLWSSKFSTLIMVQEGQLTIFKHNTLPSSECHSWEVPWPAKLERERSH